MEARSVEGRKTPELPRDPSKEGSLPGSTSPGVGGAPSSMATMREGQFQRANPCRFLANLCAGVGRLCREFGRLAVENRPLTPNQKQPASEADSEEAPTSPVVGLPFKGDSVKAAPRSKEDSVNNDLDESAAAGKKRTSREGSPDLSVRDEFRLVHGSSTGLSGDSIVGEEGGADEHAPMQTKEETAKERTSGASSPAMTAMEAGAMDLNPLDGKGSPVKGLPADSAVREEAGSDEHAPMQTKEETAKERTSGAGSPSVTGMEEDATEATRTGSPVKGYSVDSSVQQEAGAGEPAAIQDEEETAMEEDATEATGKESPVKGLPVDDAVQGKEAGSDEHVAMQAGGEVIQKRLSEERSPSADAREKEIEAGVSKVLEQEDLQPENLITFNSEERTGRASNEEREPATLAASSTSPLTLPVGLLAPPKEFTEEGSDKEEDDSVSSTGLDDQRASGSGEEQAAGDPLQASAAAAPDQEEGTEYKVEAPHLLQNEGWQPSVGGRHSKRSKVWQGDRGDTVTATTRGRGRGKKRRYYKKTT